MNATNSSIVNQGIDFLDKMFTGIVSKLVVAVIIVLIGFIFGKLLGNLVQSLLKSMDINKAIKKAVGMRIPFEEIVGSFITYFIYFVSIIMALNQMGLTTDILNIISAAVMVIIILSVFLGIKDFIPNAISGIIIHNKGFYKEGDVIKLENLEGEIIHINLIETKIETKSGDIISIPNSNLTKNNVVKRNLKKYKKSKTENKNNN